MAASKMQPRKIIGTVSGSEFIVSIAASAGFLFALGSAGIDAGIVAMMLLGGVIAAPLSAWLVSRMNDQVLGTGVGALIIFLNVDRGLALFGVDPSIGLALRLAVIALTVVVVAWLLHAQPELGALARGGVRSQSRAPGPAAYTRRVRVSARSDYAIRALLELTAAGARRARSRADAIARAQAHPVEVPREPPADLRRARLIASQRGVNGGYRLARPAAAITLADVIRAVDGPLACVRDLAPEDLEYEGPAASLRDVWIALRASMRTVLEATTLADVATGELPAGVRKLLREPDAWSRVADHRGAAAPRSRHAGTGHRPRRRRAECCPARRRPRGAGDRAPAARQDAQERRAGAPPARGRRRGITVGNLGEAEVFAAGGLHDMFIAYPVWAVGDRRPRGSVRCTTTAACRVGFDSDRRRRAARGRRRRLAASARRWCWSSIPATAGRARGPGAPGAIAIGRPRARPRGPRRLHPRRPRATAAGRRRAGRRRRGSAADDRARPRSRPRTSSRSSSAPARRRRSTRRPSRRSTRSAPAPT